MVILLLSLKVLLESDHYFLLQVLQRYGTFAGLYRKEKNFDKFKKLVKTYYFREAFSDLV